ncbi:MAG: hypothetical protein OXI05_11285 [Bacteroidota bacterium]|nr:hypothetical protein [Bacteroidota bacterium]MDE2646402.1 hypothetical protein [Bacteroidota bacterium]
MITDKRLTGSEKVRRLQTVLHAKAKEHSDHRFHALVDQVWRMDFLMEAWVLVRRNGGGVGVDGETIEDIKQRGVEGWLGELSQELRDGTYTPKAPMLTMPRRSVRVSRILHRLEPPPQNGNAVHWYPTKQGEYPTHLPPH